MEVSTTSTSRGNWAVADSCLCDQSPEHRPFASIITQNLNNLKILHQAVENAIAKQPEANAELSRNWLSNEQLPAIETYFQIKCKLDMSSTDDGLWYPHTSSRERICAGIVTKSPRL